MVQTTTERRFGFREILKGLFIIVRYSMEYKKFFILAFSVVAVKAILNPIATYIFGKFIDSIKLGDVSVIPLVDKLVSTSIVLLVVWGVIQIIIACMSYVQGLNNNQLRQYVKNSYIFKFSYHLFRLPLSFHKSHKIGETMERMYASSNAVGDIAVDNIINILPQAISIVLIFYIAYIASPMMALIMLAGVALFIVSSVGTASKTVPLQRIVQRKGSIFRGNISDATTNIRIIKDFTAEEYQRDKNKNNFLNEFFPPWFELVSMQRKLFFRQNMVVLFTRIVTLGVSLYLTINNQISVGTLVIINTYIGNIFDPIQEVARTWRDIQNGIVAIEDGEAIFTVPEEKYLPVGVTMVDNIEGNFIFDNVSFGYDEKRLILEDISFTVEKGQIIALVGESGVGKSTLIDLISAYNFPTKGEIRIDGVNIREMNLNILRKSIGLVTQEITLFNDTIMNNLRYGNFDKTDEEVYTASKKAHCFEFIEKFPEKWEQIVGERGMKLSVGQKQRIAIARAILKNPKILILDEPTSALDAGSEKIITESLDKLMEGKTTFVVAHRLSTVRRADKILVFKEGLIVETGNHDSLLKIKGGEYRRLYELQIGLHN